VANSKKQQSDLEREQEALYIDPGDFRAMAPAARCKGCGVVTWRVSIAAGLRRMDHAEHAEECERPRGRFDRLHAAGALGDRYAQVDRAALMRRVRSTVPKPVPPASK